MRGPRLALPCQQHDGIKQIHNKYNERERLPSFVRAVIERFVIDYAVVSAIRPSEGAFLGLYLSRDVSTLEISGVGSCYRFEEEGASYGADDPHR